MEKTLTIVIPTYNMQDYLRRCLDSLIVPEEKMKQLEVLVINDGSKDNSSAIAHEYQDKYPGTFRVIDKENGNYGSCINRGLKEATGKYIKVLDADDHFENKSLEEVLEIMFKVDVDLFLTDFCIISVNDVITKKMSLCGKPKLEVFDFTKFCVNPFELIPMHFVAYRRDMLISINYIQSEGISYTDMQWVFLPMAYVRTSYYAPICLYHYLVGRVGQTMDKSVIKKSIGQLMKMVNGMIEAYNKHRSEISIIANELLIKIISLQLYKIYMLGLIDKAVDNDVMINFDNNLKISNVELYKVCDTIRLSKTFNFKFIKKWRGSSYQELSLRELIIVKLVRFLQNLKNRLGL